MFTLLERRVRGAMTRSTQFERRKRKIFKIAEIKIASLVILLIVSFVVTTFPITYASPHTDISVDAAWGMMTNGTYPNLMILDVRNQSEYDAGYIPRATLIPLWQLQDRISELSAYKDTDMIVYCRTGGRSNNASLILDASGFTKVYDMTGGLNDWNSSGYPISKPATGYTETAGLLSGGHFVIRVPEVWNGMLLILCRGYDPNPVVDARTTFYLAQSTPTTRKGFAYAASSYGAGGYCISKAVNSTVEMTRYLISTFNITGKVFLIGASMGSTVALLLAEEYPDLYCGVLEISGGGDTQGQYMHFSTIANMAIPEIRSYLNLSPINPDSMLQTVKNLAGNGTRDIEIECGGTPQQNLKAYEDRSPAYHTNISIPIISIHSSGDIVVPLSQILLYQTAVANSGHSSLYRLYITTANQPGTGHIDANVQAQVGARFDELVLRSNDSRLTSLDVTTYSSITVMAGWTWWFSTHNKGGVAPFTYQWYEGITPIQGQTSMVLPVTKITPGTYTLSCRVTDAEGTTTTSNTITLTVR
jgi:rhodanese-related sulfurtransferase/pimeloyl-ACP methyl ester carboxylesterase